MQTEGTAGNEYRVWLTGYEVKHLRHATASQCDGIIIQLGAFMSLRSFEIPQVYPHDVSESTSGQ